jgi:hypothetical protein
MFLKQIYENINFSATEVYERDISADESDI